MSSLDHIVAVATENQRRMTVGSGEDEKRGGGGGAGPGTGPGGAGKSRTRALTSLKDASMSSIRGRASTFSDTMSDACQSDASKRRPANERDRLASLINLKRGSTLYFGKDISTSMWWKYRQMYDGVSALRDGVDGKPIYENSYQTEPKPGCKFAPGKVEVCIRDILAIYFENESYNPRKAVVLTQTISEAVKEKVKGLGLARYRWIVNVDIGSRIAGQEVLFASRFLWNTDTDGFATVTHQNKTMYVVVTVYGVYMD